MSVAKSATPSNCKAVLILPAMPAVGQDAPEHVPILPFPEASAKVLLPAGSSRWSDASAGVGDPAVLTVMFTIVEVAAAPLLSLAVAVRA